MDPIQPAPAILENPDFAFAVDLLASIEAEETYATADLGPTNALPEEHRILEYELFYGPLSPDGTPSPSPISSRSASPILRTEPSVPSNKKPSTSPGLSEPPVRKGNSKTRRNKAKSHANRTVE